MNYRCRLNGRLLFLAGIFSKLLLRAISLTVILSLEHKGPENLKKFQAKKNS